MSTAELTNKLLKISEESVPSVFSRILHLWNEAFSAKWAWLWIFNETGSPSRWEIVSIAPHQKAEYAPDFLTIESPNCITELAWTSQKPVLVRDLSETHYSANLQPFRVNCAKSLAAKGCKSFLTVPLLQTPPSNADSADSLFKSVICLHFDNTIGEGSIDRALLENLGRITAIKIESALERTKKELLLKLNELSEEYLSKLTEDPETVRRIYCQKVIPTIKKYVGVRYVSIFYRDYHFNNEKVSCLATTGLRPVNGPAIPNDRLGEVRYDLNQNLTGTVFATGEPVIAKVGDEIHKHPPKYLELMGDVNPSDTSWIMHPMRPSNIKKNNHTLGVIRCVCSDPPLMHGKQGNFTQYQAQILNFISRQISPVLEAFEKQISREAQIAMVRHDIGDPIKAFSRNLITFSRFALQNSLIEDDLQKRTRDLLQSITGISSDEDFERWLCEKKRNKLKYELSNLLVQQRIIDQVAFELQYNELLHYNPKLVHIPSEIIAPLKSIYWHLADERNSMKISFHGFDDPVFPRLHIDLVEIQRVFVNLLTNAIKYGEVGSTIEVFPVFLRDSIGIIVSNEGAGIELENSDRIFEGRYRTPWAISHATGAGLGLKISRAVMEKHGGELRLRRNASPTEFLMSFPYKLKYIPN